MTARKASKKATQATKGTAKQQVPPKPTKKGQKPNPPPQKKESKQAQLLVLLQQVNGTSVAEAASALGWQEHSIRGVLSGVIRKKLKLPVEKFDTEGVTRYRLAG